jgi:uncharacterized protein (DUF433 family)
VSPSFAILRQRLWSALNRGVRLPKGSGGRGWYLADEVARLAGVSSKQIGRWVTTGLIRSSQASGGSRAYSYEDVAEAIIVHELIRRRVPRREIRNVVARTRKGWGNWPLTNAPLVTSETGGGISKVLLHDDEEYYDIGDRGSDQGWAYPQDVSQVIDLLGKGGWAILEFPEITRVEVHPDILGGTPTVRGHRVPVSLAAELGRDPDGRETLREDYDLTDSEIDDAVKWEDASSKFVRAA